MRFLLGISLLLVGGGALQASLILVSPIELTGTGLGSVNTVLTLTSPANATIETGCVAPSGSGATTSGCGFADSNVQAQFGAPSLAALGISGADDLRIVFNASEPAGNDIRLNSLVLTLYAGASTFSAGLSPASGILFPSTNPGVGNSGFVFALASPALCAAVPSACPAGTDDTEAAAAQAFITSNGGTSSVRVGLGTSLGVAAGGAGSATGGLETFFVESQGSIGGPGGGGGGGGGGAIPEPSTYALLGGGLLGMAAARRLKRAR